MGRRTRRAALRGTSVALVAALLAVATAAPTGSAGLLTVRLDRTAYLAGQLVNVTVEGADPGAAVAFEVADQNGTTVLLKAATADALGQAFFQFRIPAPAATGVAWTVFASSSGATGAASLPIVLPAPPVPPPPPILPTPEACGPFETGSPPNCTFVGTSAALGTASVRAGENLNVTLLYANPELVPSSARFVLQLLEPDGTAVPPSLNEVGAPARTAVTADFWLLVPPGCPPGAATLQAQILSGLPSDHGEVLYWTAFSVEVIP